MSGLTEEITFRISPEHFAALEAAAKDAKLGSANLMARRLVIDAIKGETQSQEILLHLQEIDSSLQKLRGNIATSTQVLLMAAHHPDPTATAAEVANWVARNLPTP